VSVPVKREPLALGDDSILTRRETAKAINTGLFTLDRKRREPDAGGLPWVQLSPHRVGYRWGDIKAFITARRHGAPEATGEAAQREALRGKRAAKARASAKAEKAASRRNTSVAAIADAGGEGETAESDAPEVT
jgi:hypothetical protein